MNDEGLSSPAQIKAFLDGSENLILKVSKLERYDWIESVLKCTGYLLLSRKDRGVIFNYLVTMTDLSRQQLSRLIAQFKKRKCLVKKKYQRHEFKKLYTREDILLLAQTDKYHQTLSGKRLKKVAQAAFL